MNSPLIDKFMAKAIATRTPVAVYLRSSGAAGVVKLFGHIADYDGVTFELEYQGRITTVSVGAVSTFTFQGPGRH